MITRGADYSTYKALAVQKVDQVALLGDDGTVRAIVLPGARATVSVGGEVKIRRARRSARWRAHGAGGGQWGAAAGGGGGRGAGKFPAGGEETTGLGIRGPLGGKAPPRLLFHLRLRPDRPQRVEAGLRSGHPCRVRPGHGPH